jgi:hypothetical protein
MCVPNAIFYQYMIILFGAFQLRLKDEGRKGRVDRQAIKKPHKAAFGTYGG